MYCGRGLADRTARLPGSTFLRQEVRPSRRPPAATPGRTEPPGNVSFQHLPIGGVICSSHCGGYFVRQKTVI